MTSKLIVSTIRTIYPVVVRGRQEYWLQPTDYGGHPIFKAPLKLSDTLPFTEVGDPVEFRIEEKENGRPTGKVTYFHNRKFPSGEE